MTLQTIQPPPADPSTTASSSLSVAEIGHQRASGRLSLRFAARGDGGTKLADLGQHSPCRALFPTQETGEPPLAVMINTAGGLVGGDCIEVEVAVDTGAAARITTQAAEKVYRSLGDDCVIRTKLVIEPGARLEWLPQETILFDGSRLDRALDIRMDRTARLMAAETVLFGRQARGEQLTYGFLLDNWRLSIDGRLVWADAVGLDGDLAEARTRPWGFGDAAGYASLIVAGDGAADFLAPARTHLEARGLDSVSHHAGVTLVNGALLMRFMAPDGQSLRAMLSDAILALRPLVMGLPAALPRAWSI